MSAIDPQFSADFTDRYGEFLNPYPEVNSFREFLKLVPPKDRAGKQFRYPIQAAFSHGQTADITGTSFALRAARSGAEREAILDGCDLYVREDLPYSAVLKGRNGVSLQGDAAAYWEPYDKVMWSTMRGIEYYNELMLMYGPGAGTTILSDIGEVATTAVISGGPNYNSVTHPVVNIKRGKWAAGLWNAAVNGGNTSGGMLVDVINNAGTSVLVTDVMIEFVGDPALCQVQMTATGSSVNPATAVTAGHRFLPAGWYNKGAAGVLGILQNTGTFANIDAGSNNFWRARQFNAGVLKMTRQRILSLTAKLQANGGKTGLKAWGHASTFADLAEEASLLTRWNNSMGDNAVKIQGADSLEYLSPVGTVAVVRHEYMMQGFMFFLEPESCVRVGASDITFKGADGGNIVLDRPDNAGAEVRALSQQAALLKNPFHNALAFNIKNTDDDVSAGDAT